jgi:hypothetical protein
MGLGVGTTPGVVVLDARPLGGIGGVIGVSVLGFATVEAAIVRE